MKNPMAFFKEEEMECVGSLTLFNEPIVIADPCLRTEVSKSNQKALEKNEEFGLYASSIYIRDVLEGTYLLGVQKQDGIITKCSLVHESEEEVFDNGRVINIESGYIGCYPVSNYQQESDQVPQWFANIFEALSEEDYISSEGLTIPFKQPLPGVEVYFDKDENFVGLHLSLF